MTGGIGIQPDSIFLTKTGDITHDARELNGLPGTLVRLARVEGETLTIDPYTTSGTIYEPDSKFMNLPISNLKVRRWDHTELDDGLLREGAIPIEEDVWIELQDGVVIKFEPGPPVSKISYRRLLADSRTSIDRRC